MGIRGGIGKFAQNANLSGKERVYRPSNIREALLGYTLANARAGRLHLRGDSMAASASAPPPLVADLDGAQSWFYRDDTGGEQGPFPATSMRSWLLHGMLPHTTAVAPSFYGEVPEDFWTIPQIWEDPSAAWAGADAQLQQPAAPAADGDALWKARVAELSGHRRNEAEDGASGPAARDGKASRPGPYDRPDNGDGGKAGGGKGGKGDGKGKGLQPLSKGKGDGKGKGKGDSKGGKGGGKGKSGGRGDPNRALPPHLCRIRALAAAQSAYADTKFTPAGSQKSSYSYGS